jgi:(E)-4-hydroxy-3-methylbut-2-enyl-diphosphate synthase
MEDLLQTETVWTGKVPMGGCHPVVVQSMTNTPTVDVEATVRQTIELAEAGSEIVRWTVNTEEAAQAVPVIMTRLEELGHGDLPIVGDFHYNGHTLLTKYPMCAAALDKYRINPGNVGYGEKHDYNFETMVKVAIENDKPVRIGVNWGSLDQELFTEMMDANAKKSDSESDREVVIAAMVESAMRSADLAEKTGLARDKIVLSVKMSEVQDMVRAYEGLHGRCVTEDKRYALHLGLTEAGAGMKGVVSSSSALAILLQQGIGDTIRISLTPKPGAPRTEEVEACRLLLQSLDLRHFKPLVTSCPGCGRTSSKKFQEMAKTVSSYIDKRMPDWKRDFSGVEKMKVAVMGCVVNGPGESKHADIGISMPGDFEKLQCPVFIRGQKKHMLTGDKIGEEFLGILEGFVKEEYGLDSDSLD